MLKAKFYVSNFKHHPSAKQRRRWIMKNPKIEILYLPMKKTISSTVQENETSFTRIPIIRNGWWAPHYLPVEEMVMNIDECEDWFKTGIKSIVNKNYEWIDQE